MTETEFRNRLEEAGIKSVFGSTYRMLQQMYLSWLSGGLDDRKYFELIDAAEKLYCTQFKAKPDDVQKLYRDIFNAVFDFCTRLSAKGKLDGGIDSLSK